METIKESCDVLYQCNPVDYCIGFLMPIDERVLDVPPDLVSYGYVNRVRLSISGVIITQAFFPQPSFADDISYICCSRRSVNLLVLSFAECNLAANVPFTYPS